MAQYRFVFDEAFLTQAVRRHRQLQRIRRGFSWFIAIFSIILGILVILLLLQKQWGHGAFYLAVIVFTYGYLWSNAWRLKRWLRKSPHLNDSLVITLTSDGVRIVGSKIDSTLKWSAFTQARVFCDGVLLYQGPGVFNWLPEVALSDGTLTEVESLIQANVEDYRFVE